MTSPLMILRVASGVSQVVVVLVGADGASLNAVSERHRDGRRDAGATVDAQSGEATEAADALRRGHRIATMSPGRTGTVVATAIVAHRDVEARDAAEASQHDGVLETGGDDIADRDTVAVVTPVVTTVVTT